MDKSTLLVGIGLGFLIAWLLLETKEQPTASDVQAPPIVTTYKNDEIMQIWRDKDGYITKTHIKRDAKTGG